MSAYVCHSARLAASLSSPEDTRVCPGLPGRGTPLCWMCKRYSVKSWFTVCACPCCFQQMANSGTSHTSFYCHHGGKKHQFLGSLAHTQAQFIGVLTQKPGQFLHSCVYFLKIVLVLVWPAVQW